ncbi:MAG: endonuclease III [Armatimonadota bacterium]
MPDDRINRIKEIIRILHERYPDVKCTLDFETPFQLLVATILAAQSTDVNINKITPALFKKYPDPKSFAEADVEQLEKAVYSSGFFKQKTRSIMEASQDIMNEHNGLLPENMESLVKLRGVGRKTANVVLGAAFGKQAIIVDTHMLRLSGRLAFVDEKLAARKDAEKVEQELMKVVPEDQWTLFSHLMVYFGRDICEAKNPKHDICPILHLCEYGQKALQEQGIK